MWADLQFEEENMFSNIQNVTHVTVSENSSKYVWTKYSVFHNKFYGHTDKTLG